MPQRYQRRTAHVNPYAGIEYISGGYLQECPAVDIWVWRYGAEQLTEPLETWDKPHVPPQT